MQVHVETLGDVRLDPATEKILAARVEKLRQRLRHMTKDAARLDARFTQDGRGRHYICNLELKLPGRTLVAKKGAYDLKQALHEAYKALEKELERYRVNLYASLKSRSRKTKPAPPPPAPAPDELRRELDLLFQDVLQSELENLYRMARHELVQYQMNGILPPGLVLPQDVVDEAVVRVYRRLKPGVTRDDIRLMLLGEVFRVAVEMAREAEMEKERFVSLESSAEPVDPAEEVTTLGEEILYFYEPDEALRVEDVVADSEALLPEEVAQNEELQRFLYQLLGRLPEDQRQAFVLVVIEEFSPDEVALALGRRPDEIRDLVAKAEATLADALTPKAQPPMEVERMRALYRAVRSLPLSLEVEARIAEIRQRIRQQPAGGRT